MSCFYAAPHTQEAFPGDVRLSDRSFHATNDVLYAQLRNRA